MPIISGSIADAVARLALWTNRPGDGFIRAIFTDANARDTVLKQLRPLLPPGMALHVLNVPNGPPEEKSAFIIRELQRLGPSVISIQNIEAGLPPDAESASRVLHSFNARRENFRNPGQHTIWWLPSFMAEALNYHHHDLDSWFLKKIELNEILPDASFKTARSIRSTLQPVSLPDLGQPSELARQIPIMQRERAISRIVWQFGILENFLRLNSQQMLSLPTMLVESLCSRLLNCLYGWNLYRYNFREDNIPAVDLIDREKRIAVQITINDTTDKIRDIHRKAVAHNLAVHFDRMIIFFLVRKAPKNPKPSIKFTPCTSPSIEVFDLDTVISDIRTLDVQRMETIAALLEQEIGQLGMLSDYDAGNRPAHLPFDSLAQQVEGRSSIPTDTANIVFTRAGHRCSVDGAIVALEIAHIMDRGAQQDNSPENLLLLCANCHARSHKEKWGAKTLIYYRDHPFITRGDASAYRPTKLPYPSLGPFFKGREAFLVDLRTSLVADSAATIRAYAIHGMGGIGKTRAAVEYAWRFAGEYSALFLVGADTPEALSHNLASLCAAGALDLPEQHALEQFIQEQAVIQWLKTHRGWLLIIDKADSNTALAAAVNLLVGLRGGHVLITTRLANFPGTLTALDLDVLAPADAAAFLLARTYAHRLADPEDEASALKLAGLLGGLALALEQAAAYVNETRVSLAEYITRWHTNTEAALHWFNSRTMHYPRCLAVTYQTSVDQLSESAKEFFRVLSWLSPDPIPLSALESKHAPPDARALLAEMEDLSLARRNNDGSAFAVHRIVQEISRRQQAAPNPSPALLTALVWLDGLYVGDPEDVRTWPALEPLTPHAQAVALHAAERDIPEPTADLLNQVALLYKIKAQYATAEPLMRQALAIDEITFGQSHPRVAAALNNLAGLLQATNRLSEAEPLYRQALAINEAAFGKDHPKVAEALNNLAQLFQATNRLPEAEPLYRQALAIWEASLGENHPNVATALSNLAEVLQATNRLSETEPLYRRALAIDEAAFGMDHPKVAAVLNNLAELLQATNRLPEAEPLYRRALAIWTASLGERHPNVATGLNNLASLIQASNRFAEAEPLMRRVVEISEMGLGEDHPQVAAALNNLAGLLQATNRLPEAEPLYRQALAINEAAFGEDHPKVAETLNNLAQLFQATNRLPEAEPLYRQALAIWEASLGKKHPNVATALSNLAEVLQATNRPSQAEPLYRQALAIDEAAFGKDHPKVAIDLNNLAIVLWNTNRHADSEPLVRRALAIDEAVYGKDHPKVAIDLNNLAAVLWNTNHHADAEPLVRRALAIDEAVYGKDHPKVAIDLNNLAAVLWNTNRHSDAEPLVRRHLEIFVEFTRATGHPHPNLKAAINNYGTLLIETGYTPAQAVEKLNHLLAPIGASVG